MNKESLYELYLFVLALFIVALRWYGFETDYTKINGPDLPHDLFNNGVIWYLLSFIVLPVYILYKIMQFVVSRANTKK